jgi:hypothetical protein
VLVVLNYHGLGLFSLQTYGAQVDQLHADSGGAVDVAQVVEQALRAKKYKIVTITHVDTSTGAQIFPSLFLGTSPIFVLFTVGVLSDPEPVADAVKRVSPETLVVLDAVCAVEQGDPDGQLGYRRCHYRQSEGRQGPRRASRTEHRHC